MVNSANMYTVTHINSKLNQYMYIVISITYLVISDF